MTAFMIVMSLFFISQVEAKQTFYNSLDSKEAVEAGGGKVHAGSFEKAHRGNGFLADGKGDAVSFPTAEHIKQDVGSIALWVKVIYYISEIGETPNSNMD